MTGTWYDERTGPRKETPDGRKTEREKKKKKTPTRGSERSIFCPKKDTYR